MQHIFQTLLGYKEALNAKKDQKRQILVHYEAGGTNWYKVAQIRY